MKLEDYKPFYNCYFMDDYKMVIDGKEYLLKEDEFWNIEGLELDDFLIGMLDTFDQFGFMKFFKYFETENDVIDWLENMLSNYANYEEGKHIDWLLYTLEWFLPNSGNFKSWQILIIEKWLVGKLDVYSKVVVVRKEYSKTLKDMFKDASELDRITEQLKKKSFINQEGVWQGKRDPHTGKTPKEKQLAALAVVIEEKGFLKSKSYTDKAVGAAFCDYFQLETQGYYFKFGQRMQIEDQKSLFNFI